MFLLRFGKIDTALRKYQDINQAFQAVLVFLYMGT
ncbi:hypothetical protein XFLM_04370 [Xylella fastidiosa subsp. fastidiosa GB514]|nr:hypothetical protein XFLM_04370 [Xylella fastidiosa subsp. fastidiosa GB514]